MQWQGFNPGGPQHSGCSSAASGYGSVGYRSGCGGPAGCGSCGGSFQSQPVTSAGSFQSQPLTSGNPGSRGPSIPAAPSQPSSQSRSEPVSQPASAPPQQSQPTPSPLLRIRAGIEKGSHAEVTAGVREADEKGVVLAANVRDMITQWLAANGPKQEKAPAPASEKQSVSEASARSSDAAPSAQKASAPADTTDKTSSSAPPPAERPVETKTAEHLRGALLKFFSLAPKGSDGAAGLGIIEGEDGNRYLPLPMLGKAVGLSGQDFEVAMTAWKIVNETPPGTFLMTDDARAVGLVEWAGWEEFSSSLDVIVKGTRDPAFEPRSIQGHVARAARGAVRSGPLRQSDVLQRLKELSSDNLPEDAAPALRSAIQRRARLALTCLVDAIASQGLGPQAGVDSMGLVGQLPRALFGIIFDNIDDRDRGACAFLGEILQSWDRRRCFSKRWLQDAAGKFSMPKGANVERDEGRGWYALTAENLHKTPPSDPKTSASEAPVVSIEETAVEDKEQSRPASEKQSSPMAAKEEEIVVDAPDAAAESENAEDTSSAAALAEANKKKRKILQHDDDDDETVNTKLEESRRRRAALMAKYQDGRKG